ncbi:sugar transferase [Caldithrix abyssi DSM 13497]|uniref:Sugar transferase n=1 Tax=Caldithrix abyssi DSM 13497 TaxID=880073 RepID=H1XWL6_CALAY|nr:Sugar transferase involved in LPS biosynthesis (colanic, teichoic acid) [Caldithrix abyssi DSM 13497]EHO41854.1 sugar transferase [Caldithrix abyssi DSM 13497]
MYRKFFKSFMDFTIALTGLILISPVLLLLSIVLLIQMGRPIFFVQTRPGYQGKPFGLIKFRTMKNEVDKQGNLLPDEKRLTRFGQFLRSTSLDELPELFNVLKGDMSLVGPRPLLMEYLPLYSKEQARRHEVKPGITGWAQVNGRNALTWQEKFKLDVWYVDHVSFWLDLKILSLTILKVLKREGINHPGQATMEKFTGFN